VYYRNGNDIQNARWTVNNAFTGQKVNRIFGSLLLKYDILKNLNVSYRVGIDNYSDYNFLSQNKGGTVGGETYQLGLHRTVTGRNTIWNHDFLIDWNKNLSSDLNFAVNAGINSQERSYEQEGEKSTQQLVYGLFDHDNFIVHDNTSEDGTSLDYKRKSQSIGAFAQGTFSYKEYAYLTIGGRNSWTSNLEKNNRSLFYPSASISFIPTSAFAGLQNSKAINYLKLRLGYATSANFGDPYSTRPTLGIATNVFQDRVGTVINANAISNRLANPDLKAELIGELEAGIEGKFINNRLNIDLTFYRRVSKDQILDRALDPASGYGITSINAGSVSNKGIELALGYTVVRAKNWRWQLDGNFTLNRSKVFGLPSDVKQVVIDGFSNLGVFALNDQPLGVIQASSVKTDPKTGQRIVDGSGNYIANTGISIIGDPTAKYKLTGISTLGYKGFSFRMQWDYTKGGQMLAFTPGTLVGRGLTKDTDFDRLQGFILPGVKEDGTPNNIQISASQAYFNNLSGFFGGNDLITYDATLIRLREASLSYALPEALLSKTPFGGISFTLTGQNLFYKAPNFPKYVNFDPETTSLGVGKATSRLEFLSGPTSRRLGASLRITF
jgi:outer membrane receptor protein involved in Fe transport